MKENGNLQNETSLEEEIKRFWHGLPWSLKVIKPKRTLTLNTLLYACDKIRPIGYCSAIEKHDFWEFIMISKGKGIATADDNEFLLSDGLMFAHKPMSYHGIRETGGEEIRILIASFEILGEKASYFENKLFHLTPFQNGLYKASCISLDRYYKGIGDETALHHGTALFEALLTDILISAEKNYEEKDTRYHEILETLNYSLYDKLTLDDLCARCNMSKSLVKKIFAKYADCGVMTYYSRLKLRHAAELIAEGISAEEVAKRMSFSSTEYFIYCFKKELGMTPRQYLKRKKR